MSAGAYAQYSVVKWGSGLDCVPSAQVHGDVICTATSPLGFKSSLLPLFDFKQQWWGEDSWNFTNCVSVCVCVCVCVCLCVCFICSCACVSSSFISTDCLSIHLSVILSQHLFSCNHFFCPVLFFDAPIFLSSAVDQMLKHCESVKELCVRVCAFVCVCVCVFVLPHPTLSN